MLEIPVIRWGKVYESLETTEVVHFNTGEPIAKVHSAVGGLVSRDMRKAGDARKVLKQFTCEDLIAKVAHAADLFEKETLSLGNGTQTPDEFVTHQSASTGLPEHMCRQHDEKLFRDAKHDRDSPMPDSRFGFEYPDQRLRNGITWRGS